MKALSVLVIACFAVLMTGVAMAGERPVLPLFDDFNTLNNWSVEGSASAVGGSAVLQYAGGWAGINTAYVPVQDIEFRAELDIQAGGVSGLYMGFGNPWGTGVHASVVLKDWFGTTGAGYSMTFYPSFKNATGTLPGVALLGWHTYLVDFELGVTYFYVDEVLAAVDATDTFAGGLPLWFRFAPGFGTENATLSIDWVAKGTFTGYNAPPVACIQASGDTQCGPVTLDASCSSDPDGTIASYSWSTGATTASIAVNQSGTYSVTVTDNDGATARTSIDAVIADTTAPVVTASIRRINRGGGASMAVSYSAVDNCDGDITASAVASIGVAVANGQRLNISQGATNVLLKDVEGPVTLTVTATDSSDNTGVATAVAP